MISAYDNWAHLYDWPEALDFAAVMGQLITKRFRTANIQSVLEIGCGTGNVTLLLAEAGFQLEGLDQSSELLKIASKKAHTKNAVTPHFPITWHHGDMRHFDLKKQFDACIAVYDTLNHVESLQTLETVLLNMSSHCKEGSLLVFDLNHPNLYETIWADPLPDRFEGPSYLLTTHTTYDPDSRIATATLSFQEHQNTETDQAELVHFESTISHLSITEESVDTIISAHHWQVLEKIPLFLSAQQTPDKMVWILQK
ncbi:MAG: class I SAM-dependent methyltransferase [Cyanobacteria bacterium]|nr:class I SAM-dependent methyltransferase [Cyanobacteriota bacterium]